jgi:hypothetical protein
MKLLNAKHVPQTIPELVQPFGGRRGFCSCWASKLGERSAPGSPARSGDALENPADL